MKSEAQILRDAKAYIQEHGWVQGKGVTSDGRVCAGFGVVAIAPASEQRHKVLKILGKACETGVAVTYYNDRICKTEEDVYAWFDRAIALAEAHEEAKAPEVREPVCV